MLSLWRIDEKMKRVKNQAEHLILDQIKDGIWGRAVYVFYMIIGQIIFAMNDSQLFWRPRR